MQKMTTEMKICPQCYQLYVEKEECPECWLELDTIEKFATERQTFGTSLRTPYTLCRPSYAEIAKPII